MLRFSRLILILIAAASAALSNLPAAPVEGFLYEVSTAADSGEGSLREAMELANTDGAESGIIFGGPFHIQPLSPLPAIAADTQISGADQLTASGEPRVVLDGSLAGATAPGLDVVGGNCVVDSLVLTNWPKDALHITGGGNSRVTNCHISAGVGPVGSNNPNGILVAHSPNNVIGGTASGEGNVISGNGVVGIYIVGPASTDNQVLGNRIGTDTTGMQIQSNSLGVVISSDSTSNRIGGTAPGTRNIISGNTGIGVWVAGDFNSVLNNHIGIAADGLTPLPNGEGVLVTGQLNNIGGIGANNVISGNTAVGVRVQGDQNFIRGNLIGTDRTGMIAVGNGTHGVHVTGTGTANGIGVAAPNDANVISGNAADGVWLESGGNTVQGNLIGLAADGRTPLPNFTGVKVTSSMNIIGGDQTGSRNVISGNTAEGVFIFQGASQNTVVRNFIGTDVTGTIAVPNIHGVRIQPPGTQNRVGDDAPGMGNVISGNSSMGILLQASETNVEGNIIGFGADGRRLGNGEDGIGLSLNPNGNRLSQNAIGANGGLGIDLDFDGVTPNDPGDVDAGSNGLQNFPIITAAFIDNDGMHFSGYLDSAPNTTFALELFLSKTYDPSGHGEGERWLATAAVFTPASGSEEWNITLLGPDIVPGRYLTGTASAPNGSTSEFSPAFAITNVFPNLDEIVDALLGLIPLRPEYNLNGDATTDMADAITAILPD